MLRSGQTPGLGRLSRKSVDLDSSAPRMDGIRHAHSSGGLESFVGNVSVVGSSKSDQSRYSALSVQYGPVREESGLGPCAGYPEFFCCNEEASNGAYPFGVILYFFWS